eukprot:m.148816 g.148816  ORF g.148816 m.148816 type:complete len:287 (+) comp30622_c0_seq1:274-1134(+)
MGSKYDYTLLKVEIVAPHIIQCSLNRPKKRNALNAEMWKELGDFFDEVASDSNVRVILLAGSGPMFTSGIDIGVFTSISDSSDGDHESDDVSHRALKIRKIGKEWQRAFGNIETCGKPVICCIHNYCIGVGMEMMSACDMRICTTDTVFGLMEVNIGLASDVGGLQRLPKIVANQSLMREWAFTGRKIDSAEAMRCGLVSSVQPTQQALMQHALSLATTMAEKSPVVLLSIKQFLNYTRDHSVDESLEYAITWNMGMLQGDDTKAAGIGLLTKTTPEYRGLKFAKL